MSDAAELMPVARLTELVQCVIVAAPPPDRGRMWSLYEQMLHDAQEDCITRMPWEPADSVAEIGRAAAKNLICRTIRAVTDDDTCRRLFGVAADKADQLDRDAPGEQQADQKPPGPLGVRSCARVSCTNTFSPQRRTGLYCSGNCRKRAYAERQRVTDVRTQARQ